MPSPTGILAVVAVFNPADDLRPLVRACAPADVLIVDDGSDMPVQLNGYLVLRREENLGLASSLNAALAYAEDHNYRRLLTLDQDTGLPDSYVTDLCDFMDRAQEEGRKVGALGPRVFGSMRYHGDQQLEFSPADEIIQSGMLLDVGALRDCGGFDESLFIDGVDTDVCLRLASCGYEVLTVPLAIEHEIGEGVTYSILGRSVLSTGHSAQRRYFIARNRAILLKRYWHYHPRWAIVTLRRLLVGIVLSVTTESHRLANLVATCWGFLDAIRGKKGPLERSRDSLLTRLSRSSTDS